MKPQRSFCLVVLLGFLGLQPGVSFAQQSEKDAIREEIELMKAQLVRLEQRLEALEDVDSEPASTARGPSEPAPPEPANVASEAQPHRFLPSRGPLWGTHFDEFKGFRVETHGFVDLEYIDAETDGSRSGVSTFDNHHVNVFLRAQLNRALLAHVEIEYEHAGEETEIDQAYIDWSFNRAAKLRAGRFYTPFGIERFVWYSPSNALVSRPLVMRQIVPGNFYANGLMVEGHVGSGAGRFSYEVGVTDGLGDEALANRRGSRQARDNNSSRALTGRLAFASWRWFEVGASLHTQRYATDSDFDLTFLGLDVSARWKKFVLRAEYVDATIEGEFPATDELRQEGWYAQLGYSFEWFRDFLPSVTLVTRWDDLDLDKSAVGQNDQRSWSLGANLELYQRFRFKLEYQFVDEKGQPLDNDTFLSQFVFSF